MATEPIVSFGRRFSGRLAGPVLEVGSKIQPGYAQALPRAMHEDADGLEWCGVDIERGPGVDHVVDLSREGAVEELGWRARYGTVHCHCVLEHVPDVVGLCRSLQEVLRPGGALFVSVPFAWKLHRIPVDMWRFTPQSIDYLFPLVHFDPADCAYSTRRAGEEYPVDSPPELNLGATGLSNLGARDSLAVRAARRLGLLPRFLNQRALLVESNLMMLGTRVAAPAYTFFPGA